MPTFSSKERYLVADIEQNLIDISNFYNNLDFEEQKQKKNTFEFRLIHPAREKEAFDNLAHKIRSLIREHPQYIEFKNENLTLMESTESIKNFCSKMERPITDLNYNKFQNLVNELDGLVNLIYLDIKNDKELEQIKKSLEKEVEEAKNEVKNIKSAVFAVEGGKAELIYSEASKKYLEKARQYEISFYLLLFAAGCIAFISFRHFTYEHTNIVDFVLSKLMILTVVVTLGTIFLRKASHLRKLHDQAHQTSLELQAFPLFIRSLKEEDKDHLTKELALKYFGKELDQTQNDKIGDLIQDQMKASTEMVKASTEMVKNLKDTKPT